MHATREYRPLVFGFYVAAVISVLLVICTFFSYQIRASSGMLLALKYLDLGTENNLASWWTGSLLLLTALHAVDGYVYLRDDRPRTARSWLLIGVILLALSADEVASLHERAGYFLHLENGWLALLPFAILFMGMLMYAFAGLYADRQARGQLGWLMAGFSVLLLVVLQEYIQHSVDWGSPQIKAIRTGIEEGSELLGMLFILKAVLPNSMPAASDANRLQSPLLAALDFLRLPVFWLAVIVIPVAGYVTSVLPDQQRGHPADWVASALFFMAAISLLAPLLRENRTIGWSSGWLALISLAASAGCVAIKPESVLALSYLGEVNARILILGILLLLAIGGQRLTAKSLMGSLSLAGINAALLYRSDDLDLLTIYVMTQVMALMIYYQAGSAVFNLGHAGSQQASAS